MTPQEKANELVAKMEKNFQYFASREIAIQHALIVVDEILNENSIREGNNDEIITYEPYWLKVKQEIEKL